MDFKFINEEEKKDEEFINFDWEKYVGNYGDLKAIKSKKVLQVILWKLNVNVEFR